jgi:uncharacterized protein YbcV (DUF1398 family)
MSTTIQDAIVQAARGEIPYPVLARMLREAGIRRYEVDVPSHTAVYQGVGEPLTIKGPEIATPGAAAAPFHREGLREVILANQRKEIDYDKFLERIWRSGVTRYDVDLEARTITYRGQGGEAYEERIPDVPAGS